jgi:hypothetical protein
VQTNSKKKSTFELNKRGRCGPRKRSSLSNRKDRLTKRAAYKAEWRASKRASMNDDKVMDDKVSDVEMSDGDADASDSGEDDSAV